MGVNASRVRFQLDVADAVTLRDIADGAEAVTATEASVSLDELRSAYWHDKEIPHGMIAVQVHVTALEDGSDETYKLELLVDDVAAMNNNPVAVATLPITATGMYTMMVDSKSIPGLDPDVDGTGKYLAIKATLTASEGSPSITYGAWLARSVHP